MNPALGPCRSPRRACRCTPQQIGRYRGRLSGPLRDRFDLTVPVKPVPAEVLTAAGTEESSREVRTRIETARARQQKRYGAQAGRTNADLRGARLTAACTLAEDGQRLLQRAVARLGLSARGYDRVRRVARTIADLDGQAAVGAPHVAEALGYRSWGDT